MPINKDLKLLAHPYVFILKEGSDIQGDFLDYNLLMLQVNCPETIRSPMGYSAKLGNPISEFDLYNPSLGLPQASAKMESGSHEF